MYSFLKEYVLTCQKCQEAKPVNHPMKVPILEMPSARVFGRWHSDFHGPFKPSIQEGDDEKNAKKYVLCFIDSCTSFCELIPTADTSAATLTRALFDSIISRYGLAREVSLLSDNGSCYISQLAEMCCKTFGIKRYFVTPRHPQPNSKCEEFGKSLNQSLRILTERQDNWVNSLQAVAMSYRGSSSTSSGLSPFELVFGRSMVLFCDWALINEQSDSPSMTAYRKDMAPKLQILQDLAIQNSADSAKRQRDLKNIGSAPPTYKLADQVLLADPSLRPGEVAKLKSKYRGPYFITKILPNYNYEIQCQKTGKILPRAVHASRLKPLRLMANDYRLPAPSLTTLICEAKTNRRKLKIRVVVGDILVARVDAVVHLCDQQISGNSRQSCRLMQTAGVGMTDELMASLQPNGLLPYGESRITAAGDLWPIKRLVHLAPESINTVRTDCMVCLKAVDSSCDNITSLAIPFFYEDSEPNHFWHIAQQ